MRFLLGMIFGEFLALGIFISFGIYWTMLSVVLTTIGFIAASYYPRAKYTRILDSIIPERTTPKQVIHYTIIFIVAFSIAFFLGR